MSTSRSQLARFAATFASGTMASRVLGLVRDIVVFPLLPLAARDAFLLAFKLPNMLRDMLGEGAVNAAFVPLFTETLEHESKPAFRELVSACWSAMILVFAVLTLAGIAAMPLLPALLHLVHMVTGEPMKSPEEVAESVRLMQWTFPYLLMIGLAVFAMAPLFTLKRYAAASWSPTLLNIALIFACWLWRDTFENPAWALVAGVWLGGIAQLVVMTLSMRRHAGVLWPNFRILHPGVRRAFWLLGPVIVGQAAGEVNKLVDTLFAYNLEAVTVLFVANRLVQLPLSIFGVAVAVAVLPALSSAAARGDHAGIAATVRYGLRQSGFLLLPATAGLILLGEPIIRMLFERGEFLPLATHQSAQALQYYGLGLLAFAWVKIAVQGFYAAQDTRTPVIVASVSMLLNIALNCLLVRPMSFRGLALATTISYCVNFGLLFWLLTRRFGPIWNRETTGAFARMLGATAVMSAVVYGTRLAFVREFDSAALSIQAAGVAIPLVLAGITYLAACHVLRVRECGQFLGLLRRRKTGNS